MNSRSKKMFEALKNIDMVEKQPNQMRSQVTPQENILSDISNQISSPTMNSFYSPSIELTKNEIPFDIYQSEQNTRQNMHNVTEPTLSPRPSTTAVQNIPSCSKYYVCEKADSLKLSLRKIQPTTYREYTENEIEPFSGGSSDEYTPSHEDYSSSSSSTSSSSQLCTVVKERKDTMPSSVTKELVIPPIVSNITVSGSNHLEIEAGDTVRDNDVPVKGKKRIRKEDTWTRVKTKKLKNSGKAYRTKTGRLVPERNIKPPCPEKCILGCNKKFVEEFRRKLFQDYWGLASFQRQRDFLGSCIERLELKYRRISAANPRNQNCAFYLQNDGKKVRVCKLFLMNTLGLSERTLRTVIKSKVSGSGIIPEDQRGKHNNHKKTEEEILNSIRIHIDSIPRIESHYVRSDTSRQFIDGGLSIAELHRNYKKKREDLEKEPASYDTYAKIFNTEYNIGFFAPKKDQCDQCEAYKNATEDQKGQLETKYKEHLEEKDLSRKEKEKEKERAKNHEITLAVYDLQAVMPIPVGQTSAFFYKSRLNCFNFTVTEIGNDKSKAFFWHEALGHRGAVEIGTCILNYLTDISETTPEANVVFFSDNCGGQQKNRQEKLRITLSKTYVIVPSYIIVIDWTKFLNPDPVINAGYIKIIGKELGNWIHSINIPLTQLTIIGFGSSAHVAGFTGKYIQETHNTTIYRIIGLNPVGNVFTESTSPFDKLSPTDALQVLVIHTETSHVGYCCATGTVDVIVNNPNMPQPWCRGENEIDCSHESAIEILMIAISKGPLLVTKAVTDEVLFGFPLQIDIHVTGIYHLITNSPQNPPKVPPQQWEKEPPGFIFPPHDVGIINGYNISKAVIYVMSTDDNHEVVYSIDQPGPNLEPWLAANPLSEVIVIITEEHYTDWATKLRAKLMESPVPIYVLIVDWSMYVYRSYRCTSAYSLLVASTLTNWLQHVNIPGERVEIIGFATSAHVAGMVGTTLTSSGNTIHRVVGLDPMTWGWSHPQQVEKITSSSANVVQVIHTNTRHYGYLEALGHYDIYPNGGAWQPYCQYDENTIHECSHRAAIVYYIASVDVFTLAMEAELTHEGIAVISGEQRIPFGFWLSHDERVTARIFVLLTRPNEIDPLIPTLVFEDNETERPDIIWPPYRPDQVYRPDAITRLIIYIYFPDGHSTRPLVLWINGRFTFCIVSLQRIIGQLGGHSLNSYYLIINGERDMDMEWAHSMKDTILSTQHSSLVMVADWSYYKHKSFIITSKFAMPIGQKIAEYMIQGGFQINGLHAIGYSMGAHMAGFVGKTLMTNGQTLSRISGLDPAKYMFYHEAVMESQRLAASDAHFVDVYHTNARDLGYPAPVGVVDYYINSGISQPGCTDGMEDCSHMRSIEYFIESFQIHALAIRVEYQHEVKLIFLENPEFITFGYYVEQDISGTFYIKTNEEPPYLIQAPQRNPMLEGVHGGGGYIGGGDGGAVGGGGIQVGGGVGAVSGGGHIKIVVPGGMSHSQEEGQITIHEHGPELESHHKIVVNGV